MLFKERLKIAHTFSNVFFADRTKPLSANSQSGLFNIHSFRAFLYTVSALSKTKLEPQGGEYMSAELDD